MELTPLFREYVGCIGLIHETIRDKIADDVIASEEFVINLMEKYRDRSGTDYLHSLAAVKRDCEGVFLVRFT